MAARTRPLLIAVEGPDGSGKSAAVDDLGRWLERKGRRVSVLAWRPSATVRAAAAGARTRSALTPHVTALLAAADDLAQARREVVPRLRSDRVVLVDRYAWTGIARDAARGLDRGWSSALRAPLPAPDLIVLFRQDPRVVVSRALAIRPPSEAVEAVAAAFEGFVERLLAAYDGLVVESGSPGTVPWPVPVAVVDAGADAGRLGADLHDVIRPLLAGERLPGGRVGGDRARVAA